MTLYIIGFTVLVSLLALSDPRIMQQLWFEPFVVKARGDWFRFLTHAFVHANHFHLFVNMLVLYMFGTSVEHLYGVVRDGHSLLPFLILYLGGIVFGALPGYKKHMYDPNYRSVGASGATSAVLFAHILMKPMSPVYFWFVPVPIPGFVFGALYLFYEWYQDKRGGDNVAHDAHFYGALFGLGFTALLDPRLITQIGYLERALNG
jgi:membrane associated rhomboid family serine protease